MENAFSTHWVSSKQPRKQRKYRYNAPLHIKGKFVAAHLSKELRGKHNTRALRVRTGDEVTVMRGQFSGRSGKVERVDTIHTKIFIAGVDSTKRDGTKKLYPINPSNLIITKLADDKRRLPVEQKAAQPKAAKAEKKETTKSPSKTAASKTQVKK
jgi:large subunit ribosomal protein L24